MYWKRPILSTIAKLFQAVPIARQSISYQPHAISRDAGRGIKSASKRPTATSFFAIGMRIGTNMGDVIFELTAREKWLMEQSFRAGALSQKIAQDMNEAMISLDDWLKADLTDKNTVEMALIQRAPPK